MDQHEIRTAITAGKSALGIEFGSTRIKAALIGPDHTPLATGSHAWENRLEDGLWTYSLADIWSGLQACYRDLKADVAARYGLTLHTVGAIGFSGMMHGYMPFDAAGNLLVPFRTWRNTNTGAAAAELTELFQFNIPHRWSIAHLHQAFLDQEPHVAEIRYLTTLAGYIHWQLTGEKVVGIGEASGMFPIDSRTLDYDAPRLEQYHGRLAAAQLPWRLADILPRVLVAGAPAGTLTAAGARRLDPDGDLAAGIPLCPPEGDAGTGMVATNSIAPRTGNVSAGTSVFAMIVLEKGLSQLYTEIDMVTTPAGAPVAMVHSNNCSSDLDAWIALFGEFAAAAGMALDPAQLFTLLYQAALSGDSDAGGLLAYNYFSGEPITGLEAGRPLFVRRPDGRFTLGNFMRTHLYAALAALKIGMDILFTQEQVQVDTVLGHGGFFKTPGVGQAMMAAALNVPVAVMDTAGEGGAWGIALLAAFMQNRQEQETLAAYLEQQVFTGEQGTTVAPRADDVAGFLSFMERYQAGLAIEATAVASLP